MKTNRYFVEFAEYSGLGSIDCQPRNLQGVDSTSAVYAPVEAFTDSQLRRDSIAVIAEGGRMKAKRFFVDYFAYFGEIDHEEFATLSELESFKAQLRKGAVLAFGEIKPVVAAVNYLVAA